MQLYSSLSYCFASSPLLEVCLRGRIGWIIIKMILPFIFPSGWTALTLVIHGFLNAVQPSAQNIYICRMKLMTFMCKSASGSWHFTNRRLRIVRIMCKASVFHQAHVLIYQRNGWWENDRNVSKFVNNGQEPPLVRYIC